MNALSKIDFIGLSVRLYGLVFLIYLGGSLIYPRMFQIIFDLHGLQFLTLVQLCLCGASLGLILQRQVVLSSFLILAFLIIGQELSYGMADLFWVFAGWVLVANLLLLVGVSRTWILELGWMTAGVTFFIHGVGKLLLVPEDWLSGLVVRHFLHWSQPAWHSQLAEWGYLESYCQWSSWLVLAGHLLALPMSLIRYLRPFLVGKMLLFHVGVLFSPLYFISIGFIPFWIFLCASLFDEKQEVQS